AALAAAHVPRDQPAPEIAGGGLGTLHGQLLSVAHSRAVRSGAGAHAGPRARTPDVLGHCAALLVAGHPSTAYAAGAQPDAAGDLSGSSRLILEHCGGAVRVFDRPDVYVLRRAATRSRRTLGAG